MVGNRGRKPLERETSGPILTWLGAQGIIIHRRNVGAVVAEYKGRKRFVRFGEPGQADYWFVLDGRHCEMELKRLGERPSYLQICWIAGINALGALAFWVDSIDAARNVLVPAKLGCHVEIETDGEQYIRGAEEWQDCRTRNRETMSIVSDRWLKAEASRIRPRRRYINQLMNFTSKVNGINALYL